MNKIYFKKYLLQLDPFLFLAVSIFLLLMVPFWGAIPYRDGNIDFVQAYDFYSGGFVQYFAHWNTVHPPLKVALVSLIFNLTGVNSFSYSLLGLIGGAIAICSLYYLNKKLFNKQIARLSTILLVLSPLFLANGIFSQTDYLVTCLILLSLYFYVKRGYIFYSLAASLLVLSKETGLLLPFIILSIEILYFLKASFPNLQTSRLPKLLLLSIPLLISLIWFYFLNINGKEAWNDHIYSGAVKHSTLYTVIENLLTLHFLNRFAYQHWQQLFILNFNWVYWLINLTGLITLINLKNFRAIFHQIIIGADRMKILLIILLFVITYTLSVLSIQVYTIPRYALPIIPFMLTLTSWSIITLWQKSSLIGSSLLISLFIILILSLLSSSDPLSISLWKKTEVLGEKIYGLNKTLAGNDGITYNMQYLFMLKKRTEIISAVSQTGYSTSQYANICYEIFPDPNNENPMIKILKLNDYNLGLSFPCRFIY